MVTVPGQRDVTLFVLHSRMNAAVNRRHIVQVRVHDHGTVENHHNVIFDGDDRFRVPLANRLQIPGPRRDDSVNRAVILPRLEPAELSGLAAAHVGFARVFRAVVVENLNLHA
jgi:hypothetical protein